MRTRRPFLAALLGVASLLLLLPALGAANCESPADTIAPQPTPVRNLGKIAYELDGVIYVKDLPDGEPRRVTEGTMPRWSPSGGSLSFERDGAMWQVREDGSGEQPLPQETPSPKEDERVSPDGRYRAYVEAVADESSPFRRYHRLMLEDVSGSEITTLHESRYNGIVLEGWTADSKYVLFWDDIQFSASLMADGTSLMAIPVAGGEPRPLYLGLTRPGMVSPAPGGSMLAVTEGVGRASWIDKRLALVNVDTGEVTPLTAADKASLEPAWSPDGRRIAFVSQPEKTTGLASGLIPELTRDRRLWVMNSDGSDQRPLTGDPVYRDERPLWSRDGRWLLFPRLDEDMRASLWLVPSDGGEPQRVVDELGPAEILDYYGLVFWDGMYDWWQPPEPEPQSCVLRR